MKTKLISRVSHWLLVAAVGSSGVGAANWAEAATPAEPERPGESTTRPSPGPTAQAAGGASSGTTLAIPQEEVKVLKFPVTTQVGGKGPGPTETVPFAVTDGRLSNGTIQQVPGGSGSPNDEDVRKYIESLQEEVKALEKQVEALKEENSALKAKIDELSGKH